MALTATEPRPSVLADLLPEVTARDIGLVVGGAALTGLAAQATLHTPLTPVPFTLQTAAVLGVAAALGTVRGASAMVLYLALGVAGVPWFSGQTAGWGGATFGYVLSFVAAAALVGALAERQADRRIAPSLGAMIAGTAAIYAIGTLWLAAYMDLGVMEAIRLGVIPFLGGDAFKLLGVGLVLPATWAAVDRWS